MNQPEKSVFPLMLVAAVLAGMMILGGCGDDDDPVRVDTDPVVVSKLPFPGSPVQLMANFLTIYETRDFDEYKLILDPAFETILQQSTMDEFPDVGTTLDVNEELRIHERMFSGEAVTGPNGEFVPGVLSISFHVFQASGAWTMMPSDDIIPNAEMAPFEVKFLFDRGQNYSILEVNGTIKFYVTSRDSLHQGITQQYYQMIGQVDLTGLNNKDLGSVCWGSLKAMWR